MRTRNLAPNGPSGRLQEAVKLGNNFGCYARIAADLRDIGRKHLNLAKLSALQASAYRKVEQELRETFPDLFDGKENSAALARAIFYLKSWKSKHKTCFVRHRSQPTANKAIGKENKDAKSRTKKCTVPSRAHRKGAITRGVCQALPENPSTSTPKEPINNAIRAPLQIIMAEQPEDPAARSVRPSLSHHPTSTFAIWDLQDPRRFLSDPEPVLAREFARRTSTARKATASSRMNMLNAGSDSMILEPAVTSSQFHHPPSASATFKQPSPSPRHPIGVVHDFLKSCLPPMTKYLRQFVDSGCDSEELLLAISTWSPQRIEDILDRIMAASDGTPAPFMDKMVLLNHFLTRRP